MAGNSATYPIQELAYRQTLSNYRIVVNSVQVALFLFEI